MQRDYKAVARVAAEAHARQGWSCTDWQGRPVNPDRVVVVERQGETGCLDGPALRISHIRRYLWEMRDRRSLVRDHGVLVTELWGSESRMMLGAKVSATLALRLEMAHG